jgi:hypothetical protein
MQPGSQKSEDGNDGQGRSGRVVVLYDYHFPSQLLSAKRSSFIFVSFSWIIGVSSRNFCFERIAVLLSAPEQNNIWLPNVLE